MSNSKNENIMKNLDDVLQETEFPTAKKAITYSINARRNNIKIKILNSIKLGKNTVEVNTEEVPDDVKEFLEEKGYEVTKCQAYEGYSEYIIISW